MTGTPEPPATPSDCDDRANGGNGGAAGEDSRSGRRLTRDECIEITLKRFDPLKLNRKEANIQDLADEYHCSRAAITRAIQKSFHQRWVEIRRIDGEGSATRLPSLERDLQSRYPKLLKAIVIEDDRYPPQTDRELAHGDSLHERLGWTAGQFISEGTLFRDADRIALGPGRGVWGVVEALRSSATPPLTLRGVTLMSLTGNLHVSHHHRQSLIDADQHVGDLGQAFVHGVHMRPMGHALVQYPERLEKIRRAGHLNFERYWLDEQKKPSHAILGVGAFAQGHSLYRAAVDLDDESISNLAVEPILDDLRRLAELTRREMARIGHYYCPVADLTNWLRFVNPPDGTLTSELKEIRDTLIPEINRRLLTVSDQHLQRIDYTMIIGGTAHKAHAIRELLEDSELSVRYLFTDHVAARMILDGRPPGSIPGR